MRSPLPSARTAIAALLLAGSTGARAQVDADTLKAAFVYNFALYATWPAPFRNASEITVCVPARSTLAPALGELAGKPVDARKLAVRNVEAYAPGDGCDVRVVDAALAAAPAERGVLTVCDCSEAPAPSGGIIALVREGTKLRFDVDLAAADAARITLSSKLLHLARTTR
jgi:ABC-type amino acid transport substrate-binding protein